MTKEDVYIRAGNQARLRAAKSILEEMIPRSPEIGATKEELREIVRMIETIDDRISGEGFIQMGQEILERNTTIQAAIEEEREACAMIADEMKAELSQRPEKLQYGRTQIEVAEYIGQQIRARSS
jgi:hypothetical protein